MSGHSAHGYVDPFDYPSLPIVQRLIAVAADLTEDEARQLDETDGSYVEVAGILNDHDWHTELAIADALGLEGEWGTDDVNEAVTNALHEYRDQRAAILRLLARCDEIDQQGHKPLAATFSTHDIRALLADTAHADPCPSCPDAPRGIPA